MKGLHKTLWLCGVFALAGGCSRQDTDGLGRIGRKATVRCEAVTANVNHTAQRGCQGIWNSWETAALETRVSARLRWEKSLSESVIEVQATGKTVELRGKVGDEPQKRRAGELAEGTLGVEKVDNQLQVAKEN